MSENEEVKELEQHVAERAAKTKKAKTKKAKKKPAKGKKAAKEGGKPRGKKYELTAKGEGHEFKAQAAVMAKHLRKGPKSLAELAAVPGIKGEMKTTQDPKRPLAFLLNQAKNAGLVRFAK